MPLFDNRLHSRTLYCDSFSIADTRRRIVLPGWAGDPRLSVSWAKTAFSTEIFILLRYIIHLLPYSIISSLTHYLIQSFLHFIISLFIHYFIITTLLHFFITSFIPSFLPTYLPTSLPPSLLSRRPTASGPPFRPAFQHIDRPAQGQPCRNPSRLISGKSFFWRADGPLVA
jgi:hypothetical protein